MHERHRSCRADVVLHGRPLDPLYGLQWQWRNPGSLHYEGTELLDGIPGADVNAEEAWRIARGRCVRVAVIDAGFQRDHEDLAKGVVEWSVVVQKNGRLAPLPAGMTTNAAHGTICAGLVGARRDNGLGGCGIAPEAELLLVAVEDVKNPEHLATAIDYAVNPSTGDISVSRWRGADVVVCSLSTEPYAATGGGLHAAVDKALKNAAAAGRGGLGTPVFWAISKEPKDEIKDDPVCAHAAVTPVGASTRRDQVADAAKGPELAFVAPGVAVWSTNPVNEYATMTGTSMAAPIAAGIAALLLEIRPELPAPAVVQWMRATCDKVGKEPYVDGRNDQAGHGRLNAARAVWAAYEDLCALHR
jgi:thermitase